MKCELTEEGRDLRDGIIVIVVSTAFICAVMVVTGWIQLHILGLNIIPDVPISTPLEYYFLSGGEGVTVLFLSSILLLALHMNFVKGEKLPKLFTCKRENNEEDTINTRHVQEL